MEYFNQKTRMKRYLISALLTLMIIASCTTQQSVEPKPLAVDMDFSSRIQDFSVDFLQQMEIAEPEKNYMVSPLSLHMALGMLLNGSDGDSEKEILNTLKLEGLTLDKINENYFELIDGLPLVDPKVTNKMANSMWQEQGFEVTDAFKENLKTYFKAEHYREDFGMPSTLDKINNWASDNTEGKIDEILNEISKEQVLFLINALYFKADWTKAFDAKDTYKTNFNGTNTTNQVDMMVQKDTFPYLETEKFQLVSMPYASGQYEMSILLPKEGENPANLIADLTLTNLKAAQGEMKVRKVDLQIPKFKMEYGIKLNKVLSGMGMPTLFTGNANLSKIAPPAGALKVGFVKQDTFIEVDEEGTEAAAVTTIGIEVTSLPNYPMIKCNKPFIFLITEKKSGIIQFMGRINNLN